MANRHTENNEHLDRPTECGHIHSQLPPHSSQNGGYQKDTPYQVVMRKWREGKPHPPMAGGDIDQYSRNGKQCEGPLPSSLLPMYT